MVAGFKASTGVRSIDGESATFTIGQLPKLTMRLEPSMFDAAIFDLDGTTVDTLGDFVVVLNAMLDDLALPRTDAAQVRPLVGKGSEYLIGAVLERALASRPSSGTNGQHVSSQSLFDSAWVRYQSHYRAVNGQQAHVFPGVIEGLEAMRAGDWRLACLTNKPTAFAAALLRSKGLDGYFAQVFGGDAFERKKPDPLPLLKTCEALGTSPSRTLMVGDSSNDARAARAAGCPVLLVTYGYNHGEPVREVDADGFLDSLSELSTVFGFGATRPVPRPGPTAT
ncbi:Phosphoglycolate phosphatase [Burkholderiales bacterium 8X]|nr:Phosphoglycolate phosphatase [Burkholderiales bacterium 8X]